LTPTRNGVSRGMTANPELELPGVTGQKSAYTK
jgi:hypothetical protein